MHYAFMHYVLCLYAMFMYLVPPASSSSICASRFARVSGFFARNIQPM
jgi:hypothetical protein